MPVPEPLIDMPPEIDDTVGILQLITGTMADGEAFWAYFAMKPSLYAEYCTRVQAGEKLDVTHYGEVIEQGWGTEVPQEIQDKMADEYGAEADFEMQLIAAMTDAAEKQGEEV